MRPNSASWASHYAGCVDDRAARRGIRCSLRLRIRRANKLRLFQCDENETARDNSFKLARVAKHQKWSMLLAQNLEPPCARAAAPIDHLFNLADAPIHEYLRPATSRRRSLKNYSLSR